MPTYTYDLSCLDCSFESTVTGDAEEVLDAIDEHHANTDRDGLEHFVNFAIRNGSTSGLTGATD